MLRVLAAVAIVLALVGAGCTSKLGLTPAATLDKPAFGVSPAKGDANTTFHVDAGALSKYDITWDFGDGASAHGGTAEHKYGFTNGVMTITLLATDPASGKQAIATRTVTLGNGNNQKPSVSMSASPSWTEIRKTVTLNVRASDGDRDPLDYLWTYTVLSGGIADDGHGHVHGPDGKAAAAGQESILAENGTSNSVTFDAAGKYQVKVRARDPKNGEDAATTTIDVSKR
ncbi:MAG: PKD domain-containing protein, partial [Candidatus Thermoplasmatota archaeon]